MIMYNILPDMKETVYIVPEPKTLKFSGKWFDFEVFQNFPSFLAQEFNISSGSWKIEKTAGEGTGIRIKNGVVEVWGDKRIYFATIIQLVKQGKGKLPEVEVVEELSFRFRGFHLDIARGGVPRVETFKRILRWLFLLKYNYFAIYFEDLFPWKKYPTIGVHRGRLPKKSLKRWSIMAKGLE